ncbi:MAG TPA: metalloregulator ArsR/SmtB family transcription factor [Fimbriimonadaceae bacterium]|nr:metalloregulator ArsR/SmtB family transcription factor [Fimbriimonadaceae bacterium]
MTRVFEELADPSRRNILAELRTGSKRVTDIVEATGLKQPNVSNHLAKLRAKGVVESTKVGREVYYSFASPDVAEAVRLVLQNAADLADSDTNEPITEYAYAAIAGDESACNAIVDSQLRRQVPLLKIYVDLLTPAMAQVGQWYKSGEIDEAQEHLASGITERMMSRAMSLRSPSRRTDRSVVLGCPPGNWHALGLRMVSDYLKLLGWKTLFLGANVPTESFISTVRQHQPDLVLTSCATDDSVHALLPLLDGLHNLRNAGQEFSIGVGGGIASEYRKKIVSSGADFVAGSLEEFAEQILPRIPAA